MANSLADHLNEATLADLAGWTSFERGLEYYILDRVKDLRSTEETVTAEVEGTCEYDVAIRVEGGQLVCTCDCPFAAQGNVCKHVVATGVAWLASQKPPGSRKRLTIQDVQALLLRKGKNALVEIILDQATYDRDFRRELSERIRYESWEEEEADSERGRGGKRVRFKRPHVATLNEVDISREGEVAIIEYKDASVSTVHLTVGPELHQMTDRDILDCHNEILSIQEKGVAEYVAVEVPEGRPQIRHFKDTDQWVPRGDVLRCSISDGGAGYETTILVDEQELSVTEFGHLLSVYNGWGMRISFVPDCQLDHQPRIVVRNPED